VRGVPLLHFAPGSKTFSYDPHLPYGWAYQRKGSLMEIDDKIGNAAEELGGKAKQVAGDATDNASLEAEGHAQEARADMKQGDTD
jgi:uncharacterized protein YjbJ (UPF0337 family)